MGLRAHDSLRSAPLSSSWASAMDTDGWTAARGDVPRASPTTPVRDFWRSPRLRAAGFPRVYSRSDLDRQQFGHPQQIIRARDHLRPELRARHATVARLPQAPDRFAPAEDLFDELPLALTYRVPGMPGRAPVYVRAAMRGNVLRDMGRHAALAELVDERCPIVRLVPGHRRDRHPGRLLHIDHRERRLRFGGPRRLDQRPVDREVFGRDQAGGLRAVNDPGQEMAGDVGLEQPRLVLGEGRGIKDRLVHPEAEEKAEQEVVVQLLAELALAAHAVED